MRISRIVTLFLVAGAGVGRAQTPEDTVNLARGPSPRRACR